MTRTRRPAPEQTVASLPLLISNSYLNHTSFNSVPMGCKPSIEAPPPAPEMISVPSDSPSKRKRAETPPPQPSSSDTLPDLLLTPASPQKKSRHGSSSSLLSSDPPSIGPMSPATPLTPPDTHSGLLGSTDKDSVRARPMTPPDTEARGEGSAREDTQPEAPPSPTPNRRNIDVDALSFTLGAISLTDAGAEAPEVVEKTPPPISVSPEDYRIDFGPYEGCSIQELPKVYRKQISEDGQILHNSPGLHDALTAWASKWAFGYGRHAEKQLADVPLYYLNEFVIRIKKHEEPGQEDLYVALRYHIPVRELEEPGSNYVLTFGMHRDKSIDSIPRSYIDWMKGRGIPCQTGYEDLAEAIERLHRRELADFVLVHPEALFYTMPNGFEGWEGRPLSGFPEAAMRVIIDSGIHTRRDVDGDYVYPGMKDAVALWWLVYNTSRWNWYRERNIDNGEHLCYPPHLDKDLLFPPSDVREADYHGYSRSS